MPSNSVNSLAQGTQENLRVRLADETSATEKRISKAKERKTVESIETLETSRDKDARERMWRATLLWIN